MRSSRIMIGGAIVAAALLGGAAASAAISTSPTASATDTIVDNAAGVSLSGTGGVQTTIATIYLPPGVYVLHASGDAVNWGPSDFTRCQIQVAGQHVAGVSMIVGQPNASGSQGPAAWASPFALVGGYANSTSTTVAAQLRCWHDNSNSTPYIDGDASLWAHKTSSLTLSTG